MNKPLLYGPDNRVLAGNLYADPRKDPKRFRPRPSTARTTRQNVTEYDRLKLVDLSRQIRAQVDNVWTAVKQKNSWAFGDAWDAHYAGSNQNDSWGSDAEQWLRRIFYPLCNLKGRYFDFKRSMNLSGEAWDVDGDDLMVFTETETGFPAFAFFPATRIGSGQQGKGRDQNRVVGGDYSGADIYDGIISDRQGRMIAVRVLAENGEDFTDIPARSCDLAYEPDWHDQGRGLPRIAVSLIRWLNLQDIDHFLQAGMKRAASVGLIRKAAGGQAGVGNAAISEEETTEPDVMIGGAAKIIYEDVGPGGDMYYLDSQTNDELTSLTFANPHPNSEAFVQRLERGALASLGWNYELLNIGSTGRAPTRLLADIANQSIWDRQHTGWIRASRMVNYAIAKGMKRGDLKRIDGSDPYQWEFGLPKPLSVDQGNDEAADRENLKLGTTNKAILAQKKGYHYREIRKQRVTEIVEQATDAQYIASTTPLPFDKAMEMLEQRGPNPVAQAQANPVKNAKENSDK